MFAMGKKVLGLLLLALMAAAPSACVSINEPPENKHRTEVQIGGDKGVVVEHPGGEK
jgi:hypothetical protein